jgi:acyl-CoA thioester hydrolase
MRHDIKHYPVRISVPIRWGEIDAFGHLNNVAYHRYYESARVAYLTEMGIMDGVHFCDHMGIVVGQNSCRYWAAVHFPDTLVIGARVCDIKADRFTMQYAAVSERLGRAAATGEALIVAFDFEAKTKAALPDAWTQRIEAIEQAAELF